MRRTRAAVRRFASQLYRSEAADRLRVAGTPLLDGWIRLDRARRRRGRTRAILLVAENPMMLEHALAAWRLLRDDPDFRGHLSMPRRFRDVARTVARDHRLVLHRFPMSTRLRWWDLLITANHVSPYPKDVPAVRLQHGMEGMGKVLHGQGFTYGPRRVLRKDGTPAYTRILESSEWVRSRVIERLPQLHDTIVVVGNLSADRVLELRSQRAELRTALPGEGPVVAVMSTFGPYSLMETMGRPLLREVVRLRREGRFRFVVCAHPNLWTAQRKLQDPWDERLLALEDHGIVVARPGQDWRSLLASADVGVADHTSVSIPFSLLGRPLITVPVPEGVLVDGSTIGLLHRETPTLADASGLAAALERALTDGLSSGARAAVERAVSFPGEAEDRIRRALVGLLDG